MEQEEIVKAIEKLRAAGIEVPPPPTYAQEARGILRHVPAGITLSGCVSDGASAWILCETAAGKDSDTVGQAVIDLPPGRYFIDAFDLSLRVCVGRESAAAAPLVIGVPPVSTRCLLWIRPAFMKTEPHP